MADTEKEKQKEPQSVRAGVGMCTEVFDKALGDARLQPYRLGERRAILVHKYFLGIELGYDPGLSAAIESWEHRYACLWRRERQIEDAHEQLDRIACYLEELNRRDGGKVTWEQAAKDWIARCAESWRRQREEHLAGQ